MEGGKGEEGGDIYNSVNNKKLIKKSQLIFKGSKHSNIVEDPK